MFERFDAIRPEARRGEGADAGANMGAVDVERLFEPIEVTPMADVARVLDQHNNTRMFVSENRLSRPYHDGLGWVVGASFVNNRARQDREYGYGPLRAVLPGVTNRSEEHTSELQSLMRISYAVFCLKKKKTTKKRYTKIINI